MTLYEQPANEEIRACLRIEHLLNQMQYYQTSASPTNHRHILSNILGVLNILDRSDIKIKLMKRLDQQIGFLQSHLQSPHADIEFIKKIIAALTEVKIKLRDYHGKFCQHLREQELFKQGAYTLTTIGSGLSFDAPAFHYWISQATAVRSAHIEAWLHELEFVKSVTKTCLDITRQNAKISHEHTNNGFFQKSLESNQDYQLFQIKIPEGIEAYPKIGVGKQFINIHFCRVSADGQTNAPYTGSLHFQLTCCAVPLTTLRG